MKSLIQQMSKLKMTRAFGRVAAIRGLIVEVAGPVGHLAIGAQLSIALKGPKEQRLICEVVGFRDRFAICLAYGPLTGIKPGDVAEFLETEPVLHPCDAWIGRVLDGLGNPIDGKGPLPTGATAQSLSEPPPPPHERNLVEVPLDLGVRAFNTFLPCCAGQRMGIFAGSGVGKSMLMSLLARNGSADVAVIGLIGERGREVQDFLVKTLGEEGLQNSVLVVATSDSPALMRRQAAHTTLALAQHFSAQGREVLCLMDNLTRFAQAQREIGLSAGEPPTTKGYPPSVFSELPRLLERAGPGLRGQGNITGLFAVLVEGDNTNEPVSDTVRGILDGHVVLSREIAERGRFPAIDILSSVSRTFTDALSPDNQTLVAQARRLMARYRDMEELIRLGAYRAGSDALTDEALKIIPQIEKFLSQSQHDASSIDESFAVLREILSQAPVSAAEFGIAEAGTAEESATA